MTSVKRKLRILALHGYRQSDITFKAKLGSLRKSYKKQLEFVFIQAPHEVLTVPVNDEDNGEAKCYGWWFDNNERTFKAVNYSDDSIGFDESLSLIEKTFKDSGPFDGVLGFSQGGAFLSILCAMQQKKLTSIAFDFAIIISGFKSRCAPHAPLYNEEINLPTLYIYGSTDKVIPPEMAEELSKLFINKKTVIHEGGHYVPGKKGIYHDFIVEMLAQYAEMK
ncbi:esterase CG5412 [Orussus abietinus]|uniref:esterase CG5412 n=1 Tax=Orussus abietinus TaxID=222816 RepID=UPI000626AA32|nr:esterase CG5412 [Orussus abietinus]